MSLLTVLGCYYGQECQEKPGKTVLQEDRRRRVHFYCHAVVVARGEFNDFSLN